MTRAVSGSGTCAFCASSTFSYYLHPTPCHIQCTSDIGPLYWAHTRSARTHCASACSVHALGPRTLELGPRVPSIHELGASARPKRPRVWRTPTRSASPCPSRRCSSRSCPGRPCPPPSQQQQPLARRRLFQPMIRPAAARKHVLSRQVCEVQGEDLEGTCRGCVRAVNATPDPSKWHSMT